jgi:glutamate-1-semialdehyde 2,1-aminomutase
MPLRLDASEALLDRARRVDATLADGYALARDRLIDGEYPVFARGAAGPYVWDVDGNRYVDLILAYGTVVLGHGAAEVTQAVSAELAAGFCPSMRKPVQVELLELLCEVVPGAEQALLLKTGSDATSAAVRLARAHTGRDGVIRWGYNGWHDWAATRPAGVPAAVREAVHTFAFNDLDDLERLLERHGHEIACCLMMPFEVELPEPGFLAGVQELLRRHGVVFVLDEMRSGFRLALGGAQEVYGLEPDLATYGKAMANGYPISALCGRRELMRRVGDVHISSTFFINAAEMAAAVATIDALRRDDHLERIARLGRRLQDELAASIARNGVAAGVTGAPQMPFVRFLDGDEQRREQDKETFYTAVVRRGVLLHPNHHWFICSAMSDEDLDAVVAACDAGFSLVGARR